MIRALIFDCFGVLYQGSRNYLYDITPENRHAELTDLNHASDYGYVSYAEYLQQASEMTGRSVDELEVVFQKAHQRNEKLVAAIYELKNTYKIGLLSNVGLSVMERLFPADEQKKLFDAVVLSSDVASAKPHPEMYMKIVEKLDIHTHEAIMIDDISDNVDGAIAVGMHGVQCASTDQALRDIHAIIHRETR